MNILAALWAAIAFTATVLHHKWQILVAGHWLNKQLRGTGLRVGWRRLLVHDLSKFSPTEFWPYVQHYHGPKGTSSSYAAAWRHHYTNNDHHHEHHRGAVMPDEALVELVADWFAAASSYSGTWPRDGEWPWLTRRYKHVVSEMHVINATLLTALLALLGFERCVMQSQHGDTQHGDTQHGDTQHGDTQHGDTQHGDTQHGDTQHGDTLWDWSRARAQLPRRAELLAQFDALRQLYEARYGHAQ